ncbi:MAG: hypothetical protein ACQCXQ_04530 [Verrucomicrobiales bacterium]
MKVLVMMCVLGAVPAVFCEEVPVEFHEEKSGELADEQDELSADVQQLVIEQTVPAVIELLGSVEEIMDETTDRLAETDTGGETIAAQTEIIEKIHAAAKERQEAGGEGKAGGAMMEMMEHMMGEKDGGKKGEKKGEGKKPGDQGGEGMTGESDAGNDEVAGKADGGKVEARSVPKASGNTPLEVPEEYKKAFDAYNRGMEELVK